MILIGSHRDESCLVKHVSAVGSVLGSKRVVFVCLDDVEPRLVLVHRVEDDLEKRKTEHTSQSWNHFFFLLSSQLDKTNIITSTLQILKLCTSVEHETWCVVL